MNSSYKIPFAIVFAGMVLAIAVYMTVPRAATPGSFSTSLVRPVDSNDHIIGNPAAPVQLIEYADFTCDSCKDLHDALHQIIANKGVDGKVAWVYRQFPSIDARSNALSLARAAECAASVTAGDRIESNETFWKFANELYARQPINLSEIGAVAARTGVDGNQFTSCYTNPPAALDAHIASDRQNAVDMGAQSAPFTVIVAKGKPVGVMSADYPYSAISQLVDQALAK